jgi:undecaprenyl pyrophosphate phosphatase UppP
MSLIEQLLATVFATVGSILPIQGEIHLALLERFAGSAIPFHASEMKLILAFLLFVHWRHEWASMIAGVLKLASEMRAPRVLDEKLILIIGAILGIHWIPKLLEHVIHLQDALPESLQSLLSDGSAAKNAGFALALGALLWFLDGWSKKNRSFYDWGWTDAITLGMLSWASWIPGLDWVAVILCASLLRNHSRDSSIKFSGLLLTGHLVISGIHERSLSTYVASSWDMNHIATAAAVVIAGWISIQAASAHLSQFGFKGISGYRILVAGAALAFALLS